MSETLDSQAPVAGAQADGEAAHEAQGGRSLGHWVVFAGAWAGVLALVVLRFLASPDERGYGTHEQLGLPPCMTMELAGFPCPGCGVTTSVTLMAHGRFLDAFWTQPFGVLTAILIPFFALGALWVHLRGLDLYDTVFGRGRMKRWVVPGVLFMAVAWVYKIVATFV